ncbi:tyrosine-protein phosphatase non-receptor type 23 [Orussus abietinus]|uniref:tyrosine-protein phosphatase non-receptor type 23 n=1 Tax=Orussus abietinus TaxID=222816 RepID=UPI0006252157|nr:tyrosine-protein phosphatase non-receptor type 23 [Orussus abietinus]
MEAVPRLPMMSFQLRTSLESPSFGPKLKQYIRDFYNEDPESYNYEIHQLESLRAMATRPPIDVTGAALLKKYYCQLHFLQSRFPMEKDGAAAVTFSWRDSYVHVENSLPSIRFEISTILYNIGAIHTQLGACTERTTADGMKMACAHFQCAAWAFEHLKNSYPQLPEADFPPEFMSFLQNLCLAQAQECILEKSMLDNRKPTIVAKVARQIVDYYGLALNTLEQNGGVDNVVVDMVGAKCCKHWRRYVKFKRAYHLAVTQLYQGLAAEEQQKMGERVAFYNAALAALNEARSLYTSGKGNMGITSFAGEMETIEEALTFTNDVIEGKRKAAKNENEFIYHEEVPDKDVLPTVKGASLVKGISFSVNDPEVSGPDIFARLVPMKVHEASSLYSEEKAKILRSIGAKIEERDQQLNMYLASLKLDHLSLWDPDGRSTDANSLPLPEELAERCAALNAKSNAIQDLVDAMGKLADTYHDVEGMLEEIEHLLNEERRREKLYQETMGKRPPSIVATDLTREAKKYEEAHAKASESNQALHRAMTLHVTNLRILARPLSELIAHIPSPKSHFPAKAEEGRKADSEGEAVHTRELKRILGKVDEMRRQRNELYTQLREAIAQDDLTRILVTATAESVSLDQLFAEQINKHQSVVSLIEQNLSAQDNILAALTDAYAHTAETRKTVDEILKRRELMINSLISSYDAYEDLLAKSSKGLEFYRKLGTNVSKLLLRVRSTCKVQEEEREQILARNEKGSYNAGETAAVEVPGGEPPSAGSSGGLKLRDYLMSRQKNVPGYQNQQTEPSIAAQPDAGSSIKVRANPMANDPGPGLPVPGSTGETPVNDPASSYGYYPRGYTEYYPGQQVGYGSYTYGEAVNTGGSLSQSFPKTGTTDTTSMYHQAGPGGTCSTREVSSGAEQYAGYGAFTNGQVAHSYESNDQSQYSLRYNTGASYSQYGEYRVPQEAQGYQGLTTLPRPSSTSGYQSPSPQHSANTSTQYQANIIQAAQNLFTEADRNRAQQAGSQVSATGFSNPQSEETQASRSQPQPQLTGSSVQPRQGTAFSRVAVSGHDALGHSYQAPQHPPQHTPIAQVANNVPAQSYPSPGPAGTVDMQTSSGMHGQMQGQLPVQTLQTLQPLQAQQDGVAAGGHYVLQDQYMRNQAGILPTDGTIHGSYPVTAPNVVASDAASYYASTLPTSNVAGYVDQQMYPEGVATAPGGSQMIPGQVGQSYPGSYGSYQQNSSAHGYQQVGMGGATTQSYPQVNYSNDSEMIQSHAKSSSMQAYTQGYQYPLQGHYSGVMQYPGYQQAYATGYAGNQGADGGVVPDSYKGHPGYAYDPAVGGYQYSSGYQDSRTSNVQRTPEAEPVVQHDVAGGTYQVQDAAAMYTNANMSVATSQVSSSQYSGQSYQVQPSSQAYYAAQYGLQVQGQGSIVNDANQSGLNQTYMQASNNETNTTSSAPEKAEDSEESTKATKPKSNVDLLSDLDVTINHAPLVPEVQSNEKPRKQVENGNVVPGENVSQRNEEKEPGTTAIKTEDRSENLQIVWDTWYLDVQPKKDPLGDPVVLQKFAKDIEKYEKFVDGLLVKTLSGATNLDIKWKEVHDFQEREDKKQSTNVALAHSSENRITECIPYDSSRVELSSLKASSSYINASHVKDVTQWTPAAFIVTQAPLVETMEAFWTMIWEQGSEVIACLASDSQLGADVYWPIEEEQSLTIGSYRLSLKNRINHASYIQRIISINHNDSKSERVVVLMQFVAWPASGFPSSPGPLLTFTTDVMSEQALRRCSPKPIVVHCLGGGSLSGLFLLAATTVCHVRAGRGVVDVPLVFSSLVKFRRCLIDKESLLFGYRMVLYHAQDALLKRGILSSSQSTFECFGGMKGSKGKAPRQCHPSDDFLQNLGGSQVGPVGASISQSTPSNNPQEKDDVKAVDPLSQLDPLWSIRR